MELHHLIADGVYRRSTVRHDESVRCTLVAPREDRRLITILQQQMDDIRRHGRLARASDREIAHTDSGRLYGKREQQTLVVQQMPNGYTERVEPAEGNIDDVF